MSVLLIPLREAVSAGHLAFVFLAWTIVIAELGGRAAALVTALVSALSLNAFLTRPYLSLRIDAPEDVLAFVALTVCGLIAALFGRRRHASEAAAQRAHEALAAIRDTVRAVEQEGARDSRLAAALDTLRQFAGLSAAALRGPTGHADAVSPSGFVPPDREPSRLEADWAVAEGATARVPLGSRGIRLPEAGGRLALRHGGRQVGALDLWEADAAGLDVDQVIALKVVAQLLAAELAERAPRPE